MRCAKQFIALLLVLIATGCSISNSVSKADDIGDDGKRNTVVMTYDIKLYSAHRYRTFKETLLQFMCPDNSASYSTNCFTFRTKYRGTEEVNGYNVNAFARSGTKVFQMKHGDYLLESAQHKVLVDRVREKVCTKKKNPRTGKKERICNTITNNVDKEHSAMFPTPIAINVGPGPGCYLGHLSLLMFESELVEFSVTRDQPLSAELLSGLSPDAAEAVIAHANRPCN